MADSARSARLLRSSLAAARGAIAAVVALTATACATGTGATEEVPEYTLAEDLRYPVSPDEPLTSIRAIAIAPDGSIHVVDGGTLSLLRFGADGRLIGTTGREGNGPGEFQQIYAIGLIDEALWVGDAVLTRFTLFDGDGTLNSVVHPIAEGEPRIGPSAPVPWLMTPGERALITQLGTTPDTLVGLAGGDDGRLRRVMSISMQDRFWSVMPGSTSSLAQPLAPFPLVQRWREGWVVVERPQPTTSGEGEFSVVWIPAQGSATRHTFAYQPVATSESDVEAALDVISGTGLARMFVASGRFASEAEFRSAARETLVRPDWLPPVRGGGSGVPDQSVMVSPEGTVWLESWQRPAAGGSTWEVITMHGQRSRVHVPQGVYLRAVSEDQAWGFTLDEFNVPTLVRWRMDRVDH